MTDPSLTDPSLTTPPLADPSLNDPSFIDPSVTESSLVRTRDTLDEASLRTQGPIAWTANGLIEADSEADSETGSEAGSEADPRSLAGWHPIQEAFPLTQPDPELSTSCPACSAVIEDRFNYCPFCGHMVQLVCQVCRTLLQEAWIWCPTCGHRSGPQPVSIPTRVISGSLDGLPPRASGAGITGSEAEDFNQRGVQFYEAERYDDAIEQFQRALALDPSNSLYHCNLAVAYGERGDARLAFDEYQKALDLNPVDLTAHLNLGYAYNEQGQADKAHQEWSRVIEIAPVSAEADEARDNIRSLDEA
jgi:tetratricopeptide (TPR) repeat protein